jgi:hypothetical protein
MIYMELASRSCASSRGCLFKSDARRGHGLTGCSSRPRGCHASAESSSSASSITTSSKNDLQRALACPVLSVPSGAVCTLSSIKAEVQSSLTLIVFFTHWADLGSWELAQKLARKLREFQDAGEFCCTAVYSVQAALQRARLA